MIMILSARVMIVCGIKTRRQIIDWHFVQDIFIMGEIDFTTLVLLRHIYETSTSYIYELSDDDIDTSGCISITFTF